MIERIVIENFKSLRKVDLSLGRVNLFIGANATGKSNVLDAFRVLAGIGHGFTINEILNGKSKSATGEMWERVRGGTEHACFAGSDGTGEVAIEVHGKWDAGFARNWPEGWEYRISFLPNDRGRVTDEYIDTKQWRYHHRDLPEFFYANPSLPVLGMEREIWRRKEKVGKLSEVDISYWLLKLAEMFGNAQRIDLVPKELRNYSRDEWAGRMGDHGEDFAAVVNLICDEEHTKDAYLAWLRELRPEQIDDVGSTAGAVGDWMFMVRENGRTFPAPVLSEGTLRFAALTAAFFQDSMPGIMMIEEIENGIHPSRIQILLELMRSQAEYRKTQVLATTHSATILDWLQEEDYKTTFLCRRDESTGESRICSLTDVPHFMDAVRKKPASELFSEGWMEMAP